MQPALGFEPSRNFDQNFDLKRQLPDSIARLEDISRNFYWSWRPAAIALFRSLDPTLWQDCEQNPRLLLKRISGLRLAHAAADADYIERLNEFAAEMDEYLSQPASEHGRVKPDEPAAYFCAEYGVHRSLPNYSGGLGILAGDHLKSASDLNIPLVAVGLLYRYGYFRQSVGHDGWQSERYDDIFESECALESVRGEDGNEITVMVHIRGREVFAKAWLARVGRIKLYLLDTNVRENNEIDRLITGHLYGGDAETRIVQEKILGIGGVRLLRKLGIRPSVFHLNEGHSAFLTLELAREYLETHPDETFNEAAQAVREQCVFTTHTPVAAGNDVFSHDALRDCFDANYINALKLDDRGFDSLGRVDPNDDNERFGMTPLAIRMTRSANGVSEKHGEVSRSLWAPMFPEKNAKDVPITHITNGVHAPTWIAPQFQRLYSQRFGADWKSLLRNAVEWKNAVDSLSDADIWETHNSLKRLMIEFVRDVTQSSDTGTSETINEHADSQKLFSPDVLTIGFARRVATYKRWNLLMTDLERLLRMVDDPQRPVQFVFAGKAHPQDREAKQTLVYLMSINNNSKWQDRAVFIEDYDQEVARYLVQGVDVWMNVPRRPHEASGTSGMKAAMNGALNFSVLDGWWIEGFDGANGFTIGGLNQSEDDAEADAADAESLYFTLEHDLIPAFYDVDESGRPAEWIARMRDAIATLTPQFSTDRMVGDYLTKIYNDK